MAGKKKNSPWAFLGRVLTIVFIGVVAWLIGSRLQSIDWAQVGESLRRYRAGTLVLAAAFAAASYTLYMGYELLGRAYTRHTVPRRSVAAVAFVSYAFNLNFGAWIGGVGFRYRLYSRHGLKPGLITRILGMSLATNWLGYLCLGGMAFVLRMVPLPAGWRLGADGLQFIGLLMLAVAGIYLGMCAGSRKRVWKLRSLELQLPPLTMAMTQLSLSVANWLAMATILFVLLHGRVPLHAVLAVLLIASIAGVITHIPAGLGVIEAVFIALLAERAPEAALLAALLAYRAIYYLAPVALAIVVYLALESRARRGGLQRAAAPQ